jgi:pimeloyl-ACP methyl ester carboxylesterase
MEIMAVLKAAAAITAAIALILLMTYWAAGRARTPLDADARAKLVKQGFAHSFIELPDGTVHYHLDGPATGPLIVLIHGFSTPSFVWDDYVEPLAKAGYRVLAYDNYGRGYSDRPKRPYDADLSDTLLVNLLDALAPGQPANLVGYSMGGATATIFAARHPERVRSLTLIAPAGLGTASSPQVDLLKRRVIGDWIVRMFGLKLFHDAAAEDAKAAPNPARFLADFDRQMNYPGYGEALLSTLRHYPLATSAHDFAVAGATSRPVMVIWGEADKTVPFANAKELMKLMPHAKLYSYEKFGHNIAFSQSALVIHQILQFLAAQPQDAPGQEAANKVRSDLRLETRPTLPAN